MTLLAYTNADALFTNLTADADGSVVLTRFNDIKTFLNGLTLDSTSNINVAGVFPWTARHSWVVTDTANNNRSLTASGVMAAGKYADFVTSAAAQVNSALSFKSITNAASSVPVEELSNAGTGDSHKVVNTNTGACYKAETSSTGSPFKAKIRGLDNFSAPLVSRIVTTPVTVAADATETIVNDATIAIPADFLQIGSTIKGSFYGSIDTPGAAPATIQLEVKFGGVGGTVLLDTGAFTPAVSLVSSLVKVEFILTCITIGGAGTIEAQGMVSWNSNTIPVNRGMGVGATGIANIIPVVVNTTADSDLIFSMTWGAATAGCSITMRSGIMELKK